MSYPRGKPKSRESKERASESLRRGRYARVVRERACVICGTWFSTDSTWKRQGKFTCSFTCRGLLRHRNVIGNRVNTAQGYWRVMVPTGTPGADKSGRMLEHRWVMQQALGRPLLPTETVHHINGDKQDNRLENLQLRNGRHGRGVRLACLDCGSANVGAVPV